MEETEMNMAIVIMNWVSAIFRIFKSSTLWKALTFGVGVAVFAGLTQFVMGSDTTTRLIKEIKHLADIYCSAPEFDQYALKRIMEDAITPHRIHIEC
jgi:hypothetical protein